MTDASKRDLSLKVAQSPNTDLANLLNPSSQQAAPSDSDKEGDGTCQFCGTQSPELLNADKMDLHYVL